MRPYPLLYLYRRRLRAHAIQELLAGLGVAIAVALVFAVIVANGSIAGSTAEVVHTVTGRASLQLRARGPDGFDERVLARVEALPGVEQAAPALEQTATLLAPNGRRDTLDVVGTDVSLAVLDGLAYTLPVTALSRQAISLSQASAAQLRIASPELDGGAPPKVSLLIRGHAYRLNVSAVLGHEAAGALSQAQAAVMPLTSLQRLAGLPRRISRILVETKPGREVSVRSGLGRLAGEQLTVAPADQDVALLRQALRPSDEATALFTVTATVLGLLLAFNAMLLTVPERRLAIADLRVDGVRRTAIVQMVLFEALCLGLLASLVGLLTGYALARGAFHQSPGYLAHIFVLGGGTVIGALPLLVAFAGGVLATCLASAVPLLDLGRGRALDAVQFERGMPGHALGAHTRRRLFAAACAMFALASAVFALAPSAALLASLMLAIATVLAVPLVLAGVLRFAEALAQRSRTLTILPVAVTAQRATTLRSLALVSTGAVAIFGALSLGGSREDLLRGIAASARGYAADADIWVVSPGDNQATVDFAPDHLVARLARVPGVARVRVFQGDFQELGSRRVWLIARPPGTGLAQLKGQMIHGNASVAVTRLGEGGWIVIPQQIAEERHVRVGGRMTLLSPTGAVRLRVAATTTNLGWPTGAVVMSTADYSRRWRTSAPAALAVQLDRGASQRAALAAIVRALGPHSGLEAVSAVTRAARIEATAGEGTGQLGEIAKLLVIGAILAMGAALTSAIWQRRNSLAGLRLEGARPWRLRLILLAESALMLLAGCLTGVVAGIDGQAVINGYLVHSTGFPVAGLDASLRPLEILGLVIAAALLIVAPPAWLASRVSPMLALEGE
jgi:putative ABC transport system permease protein